jgi:hypothetical protein
LDSEEEIMTLPISSNPYAQQDDNTSLLEENNVPSNDCADDMNVQESVTFPAPDPTSQSMSISFLCNPNHEELHLRQSRVSELFDKNLSSVQKRSWAKDSTCEHAHFTYPV